MRRAGPIGEFGYSLSVDSDRTAGGVADRDEWMRRTGPLYPGLVAVKLLTRLPVLRGAEVNAEDTGRAAPWFAVVGGLAGGALAAVAVLVLGFDLVPAIVAALVIALAALLTGALHEAELARTADILGRSGDETPLDTLGGRIGLYGILAVVTLFAIRWIVLLGTEPAAWIAAIILSQITIRWSLLLLLKIGDRLDEPSTGRSLLIGGFSWAAFAIASAIAVVAALFFGGGTGLLSIVIAALVAFFVGLYFQRRDGGLTSQTLGAASIVCELTVLVCFAVAHPAATSPWAV